MKRLTAFLLALLMLAASCAFAGEPAAAPASSPAPKVSGSWFGKLNGFPISLILNEDGSYLFRVGGLPEADSAGTWAEADGTVVLDGNRDLPFYCAEEELFFKAMNLYLTRKEETAYTPGALLSAGDSDPALFQGAWIGSYVLMGDDVLPAESLQNDTVLLVEGSKAALTGDLFGEIIADFAYEAGIMTLNTGSISVNLQMQSDYLLRMTAASEGAELTVVLSPYRTEFLTSSIEGGEAEYEEDGKIRALITRGYQNALGRNVTQKELNYWMLSVSEGTATPVQVVQSILASDECKGRQLSDGDKITALYRIFFNREPDPEGLAHWTEQLAGGMSLEMIEESFAASEEFKGALD